MLSADFKPVCSNIYKFCGLFALPFFTFLPNVAIELTENQCQSVCVPLVVTGIHLDCVFVFLSFPLFSRGVEQACRAPLNKALCSVLRISLETSSDVPARSVFNYNKILAFATVLHPPTLHVPSSLSIDRFAVLQFEPCFFRFFT